MDCNNCHKNLSNIFRSVDGSCNNLENPTWGASQTPLQRFIGEYGHYLKYYILFYNLQSSLTTCQNGQFQ